MKRYSLIIGLALGVASLALADDQASNSQQSMPSIGCMTNEEVYQVGLGGQEFKYVNTAVKTIAELDALKSMRSIIEASDMEPKAKASLVAGLNKKITKLQFLLNQKKEDLANVRSTMRFGLVIGLGALVLLPLATLFVVLATVR